MAASDHLHPYQMKLFMQAKDFMNVYAGHTEVGKEGYRLLSESPNLYSQKLQESKSGSAPSTMFPKKRGKDSLYESIKKEGVTSPVSLTVHNQDNGPMWEQINDGHHRVVAAHDIDPEMYIPIRYDD